MSETEKRIEMLGITLPLRENKGTGVVDAVLHENLLFVSAHLPLDVDGKPVYQGKAGAEVDIDTAMGTCNLANKNIPVEVEVIVAVRE